MCTNYEDKEEAEEEEEEEDLGSTWAVGEIDFGAQRLFKKGRSVKTSGQTRTRQHEKNKTT